MTLEGLPKHATACADSAHPWDTTKKVTWHPHEQCMEDYEDSLKKKTTLKNIHYIFSTLAQTPMNIWQMEKVVHMHMYKYMYMCIYRQDKHSRNPYKCVCLCVCAGVCIVICGWAYPKIRQ